MNEMAVSVVSDVDVCCPEFRRSVCLQDVFKFCLQSLQVYEKPIKCK